MKKYVVLLGMLLTMCGCAQWQAMDSQQQQLVIGTAVVSLLVGYHANNGDTIVQAPPGHEHEPHCINGKHC